MTRTFALYGNSDRVIIGMTCFAAGMFSAALVRHFARLRVFIPANGAHAYSCLS